MRLDSKCCTRCQEKLEDPHCAGHKFLGRSVFNRGISRLLGFVCFTSYSGSSASSQVSVLRFTNTHSLSFVVTLYANNAIVGILLHALSSLLFFSVYRESDIENWYKNWKDPYWYGELLNLIPSFGYACSLTYVLIVTLPMGSAPSQDPNTDDIIHAALRIQTAINMACDGMWFIDSIIYGVAWIRGTTKIQSPDENKIEEIPSVFVTENFYEKPELPVTIQERKRQKKKRKATSLSNLVTMPHYTFREAPPYERGFFHPQKKKKQGKKVVSNKRAKSKQKTKPHKSHLPV